MFPNGEPSRAQQKISKRHFQIQWSLERLGVDDQPRIAPVTETNKQYQNRAQRTVNGDVIRPGTEAWLSVVDVVDGDVDEPNADESAAVGCVDSQPMSVAVPAVRTVQISARCCEERTVAAYTERLIAVRVNTAGDSVAAVRHVDLAIEHRPRKNTTTGARLRSVARSNTVYFKCIIVINGHADFNVTVYLASDKKKLTSVRL